MRSAVWLHGSDVSVCAMQLFVEKQNVSIEIPRIDRRIERAEGTIAPEYVVVRECDRWRCIETSHVALSLAIFE